MRRYLSWIEGLTTNQYVGGSNPSRRTTLQHFLRPEPGAFSFSGDLEANAVRDSNPQGGGMPSAAAAPKTARRRCDLAKGRADAGDPLSAARRRKGRARTRTSLTAHHLQHFCAPSQGLLRFRKPQSGRIGKKVCLRCQCGAIAFARRSVRRQKRVERTPKRYLALTKRTANDSDLVFC